MSLTFDSLKNYFSRGIELQWFTHLEVDILEFLQTEAYLNTARINSYQFRACLFILESFIYNFF